MSRRPVKAERKVPAMFYVTVSALTVNDEGRFNGRRSYRFRYDGLHTDAALEAERQRLNKAFLPGGELYVAEEHARALPHFGSIALVDNCYRTLRTVQGPLFEVVA